MAEIKDKLITAENLKNAYDDNKRQIGELKGDLCHSIGNKTFKTNDFLKYTNRILKVTTGGLKVYYTEDTNILNSDFIPIEYLERVECIGNPTDNIVALALFEKQSFDYLVGVYYGDESIAYGWDLLRKNREEINIPSNAKYFVIQTNKSSAIDNGLNVLTFKYNFPDKYDVVYKKDYYNVKDYGVVGDGVTDDTDAIQRVIDLCAKNGGGTVFFPNGKYALNTIKTIGSVRGQLFIPVQNQLEQRVTIKLEGATSCMYPSFYVDFNGYTSEKPQFRGATLLSTYIPPEEYVGNPISVITSYSGDNFTECNMNRLQIEHLNIVTSVGNEGFPKVSGIDASRISSVSITDVTVGTDCIITRLSPYVNGNITFGIAMPKRLCDPNQYLREVCVSGGYIYGIICTEHVNGVNIQLQNCIHAFVFAATDHPNYFSLCSVHGSKYQISSLNDAFGAYTVGDSGIKFEMLDFEENWNQVPTIYNYEAGIYDPYNRLRGEVNYFMVKSNVGMTNVDWKAIGAENLRINSYN